MSLPPVGRLVRYLQHGDPQAEAAQFHRRAGLLSIGSGGIGRGYIFFFICGTLQQLKGVNRRLILHIPMRRIWLHEAEVVVVAMRDSGQLLFKIFKMKE